jgi:hypothetical protein
VCEDGCALLSVATKTDNATYYLRVDPTAIIGTKSELLLAYYSENATEGTLTVNVLNSKLENPCNVIYAEPIANGAKNWHTVQGSLSGCTKEIIGLKEFSYVQLIVSSGTKEATVEIEALKIKDVEVSSVTKDVVYGFTTETSVNSMATTVANVLFPKSGTGGSIAYVKGL